MVVFLFFAGKGLLMKNEDNVKDGLKEWKETFKEALTHPIQFIFGWKYILPVWLIGSMIMMGEGEYGDNPIWFWLGCISLVGGFIAMAWGGSGDIGSHDIDPD